MVRARAGGAGTTPPRARRAKDHGVGSTSSTSDREAPGRARGRISWSWEACFPGANSRFGGSGELGFPGFRGPTRAKRTKRGPPRPGVVGAQHVVHLLPLLPRHPHALPDRVAGLLLINRWQLSTFCSLWPISLRLFSLPLLRLRLLQRFQPFAEGPQLFQRHRLAAHVLVALRHLRARAPGRRRDPGGRPRRRPPGTSGSSPPPSPASRRSIARSE